MDKVGMEGLGLKIGRPAALAENEEEDPSITAAAAARAAQMAAANAAVGFRATNLGNTLNVRGRNRRYGVEAGMLSPNNNPNELEEVNAWEVPLELANFNLNKARNTEIYANTRNYARPPLSLAQQANLSAFNRPPATPNPASVKSTKRNEPPKIHRKKYRKTRRNRRNRRTRRSRR